MNSAMIPVPMPPVSNLCTSNPILNKRFAPARCPAISAHSPGRAHQIQRPEKTSASRSASAVSFNLDGSNSSVGGTSTTHGQVIAHGNRLSSSNNADNSDMEDLFKDSEEE